MNRLLELIAAHPEEFGDDTYLPSPLRQFADVLNAVTTRAPPELVVPDFEWAAYSPHRRVSGARRGLRPTAPSRSTPGICR